MSQERASERFHRLVYNHIQAFPDDSQSKAWSYVAENNKALYADYQAETVAAEESVSAAKEAAAKAKTQAANERAVRMEKITDAVEAKMQETKLDYDTCFNAVRREQPSLFATMQDPVADTKAAAPAAKTTWNLSDPGRIAAANA